jgi:adenylate cyclase
MSIRAKIVLIVLPLIIAPLLLTGYISSLSARNGITRVATSLLRFKEEELISYAGSQWSLLVANNLAGSEAFVGATRAAVESFARNMVRSPTELILAVDESGHLAMATAEIRIAPEEAEALAALIKAGRLGWQSLRLGGVERVSQIAFFEPFGWYVLVTEQRDAFYATINQMYLQTGVILAASLVIALGLLLVFSYLLTQPLKNVVNAMREIISTSDLSRRVDVLYRDETGELGHTFNLMTGQLNKASELVKSYALQAVVAQHKEQKIRTIFQKYVPLDVIDQFMKNPEAMLVGDNRIISILFSDIRDFTKISEQLTPEEVVELLNSYFTEMVNIIYARDGIIDKYVGDAIMALFGSPVRRKEDALNSVLAGTEMLEALKGWNQRQGKIGKPPLRVGIGITYGVVTVGNIGTDKKMDYTVIGDMVNTASRLEGLTKHYRQPLLISRSLYERVKDNLLCRLVGRPAPKGKTRGELVYTTRAPGTLTETETEAWTLHNLAMERYFQRDFQGALEHLQKVQAMLPEDDLAATVVERARRLLQDPPPAGWDGTEVIETK